jgi:CBS domain-containing protein
MRASMLCRDLMNPAVVTCPRTETVVRCARLLRRHGIGLAVVVDEGGKVVGVVTDRDLAMRVVASEMPYRTTVGAVMTRRLVTCQPDDDLVVAETRMAKAGVSRILVTYEGHCLGVISVSDIVHAERPDRSGRLMASLTRRRTHPPRRASSL